MTEVVGGMRDIVEQSFIGLHSLLNQ